ncbi:MAG: hypothetical protein AAF135_09395 [Bacteroidota bacterium]
MSFIFPIVILLILGTGFYRDYQRDPGQHISAKVVHALLVTILTFSSLGSISGVIQVVSEFSSLADSYQERYILPLPLHTTVVALVPFVDLGMLLLLGGMYRRNLKSRMRLIMLLPIAGILKSYVFYVSMSSTDEPQDLIPEWGYLGAAFLFCLGFFMFAWGMYRARFMVNFFEGPVKDNLDMKIEEIGKNDPEQED